jgi:hypothetical protein
MILYKNHTARKAEEDTSSAFSLCTPHGTLVRGNRHLRSLQMDVFPELELLFYEVMWGGS